MFTFVIKQTKAQLQDRRKPNRQTARQARKALQGHCVESSRQVPHGRQISAQLSKRTSCPAAYAARPGPVRPLRRQRRFAAAWPRRSLGLSNKRAE